MEMMNPIYQSVTDYCFPASNVRTKRIVWDVLWKSGTYHEPVQSLEMMVLRKLIEKKMRSDTRMNVLFRLIFREPIDFNPFFDFSGRDSYDCDYYRILPPALMNKLTRDQIRRSIYLRIRQDPHIMYNVCEQNPHCYRKFEDGCSLGVHLTRRSLEIRHCEFPVANIPNRKDHEFDALWVDEFFRMAMKKKYNYVSLGIQGNGDCTEDYMRNVLLTLLASTNPKTPKKGWESAVREGQRVVYRRNNGRMLDGCFSFKFYIVNDYFEVHESLYYSYI